MDAISALLNLGQIATKIDNQMKEGERRSMIKNSRVEWKDNDVSSADNSMDSSSEALDDRGFPMASDSKKPKNTTPEPITQVCYLLKQIVYPPLLSHYLEPYQHPEKPNCQFYFIITSKTTTPTTSKPACSK